MRRGTQPRLLPHVIQAIADLHDANGSTSKKILDQIKSQIGTKQKNLSTQIRRALKHAMDSGLIKQRGGKYRLGMGSKDYAIYKSFHTGSGKVRSHRSRRKRRRRRGRKRRRSSVSESGSSVTTNPSDDMETDSEIDKSGMSSCSEPMDRGRRRRKRKRGRRRRRASTPEKSNDEDQDGSTERKGAEPANNEDQSGNSHEPQCDNPDCICQIKREEEAPRRSRSSFRDPYIN